MRPITRGSVNIGALFLAILRFLTVLGFSATFIGFTGFVFASPGFLGRGVRTLVRLTNVFGDGGFGSGRKFALWAQGGCGVRTVGGSFAGSGDVQRLGGFCPGRL